MSLLKKHQKAHGAVVSYKSNTQSDYVAYKEDDVDEALLALDSFLMQSILYN